MVATLTRVFGTEHLDLAESVVQEAMVRALKVWPYQGLPDSPEAWLMAVAKRRALDVLRTHRVRAGKRDEIGHLVAVTTPDEVLEARFDGELEDNQLRLMFTCCHPVLSRQAQVALTLKTLCGFGVGEIARAFLARETTISQRIVRAKRQIRDARLPFEVPPPNELPERVDAVLEVLYLLFNEGYSAAAGDEAIRRDLCDESIRYVELLASHRTAGSPKVHALAALLLLQASRLDARTDKHGEIRLLEDQDRALWDRGAITRGLVHMGKAARGETASAYHLMAGMAACHAAAPSWEATRWDRIVALYDQLMAVDGSPVVALNRAVAVGMADGPQAGLGALDGIARRDELKDYLHLPAAYGEFYARLERKEEAVRCYREALRLAGNGPERRYLERRVSELAWPQG